MPKTERELRARDAKRDLGKELLQSVREMKTGHRGRVHKVKISPIAEARLKSKLSQAQFAQLLGVSVRTLQDWGAGQTRTIGCCEDAYPDCCAPTRSTEVLGGVKESARRKY